MLEIQKELDQFILTIKNTQVYKEYQLQKSKVKENPDLKRQLDQFREIMSCRQSIARIICTMKWTASRESTSSSGKSRWCMIFWQRSLRSVAWYRKYRMV